MSRNEILEVMAKAVVEVGDPPVKNSFPPRVALSASIFLGRHQQVR